MPIHPPLCGILGPFSTDNWYVLDVRQGRMILLRTTTDLVVWEPFSGEHFLCPEPPRPFQYQTAAVICAESPHCSDPECNGIHGFSVVFVGCEDKLATFNKTRSFEGNEIWASIYNLETNEWSEIFVLKDNQYMEHPPLEHNPPVLHRDALYFTLDMHQLGGEEVRGALKFDITHKRLSMVLAPDDAYPDFGAFLGTSEGLIFAGIVDDEGEDEGGGGGGGGGHGQHSLSLWTLSDNPTVWTLTSEIDLEDTLPPAIHPAYIAFLVGFIEVEATICIDSVGRIFTVEVDPLKTTDIGPSGHSLAVLPFLHFCMPSVPKPKNGSEAETSEESEDEGNDRLLDKNPVSKAEVIGKKRGIHIETPSGKKTKVEQSGHSMSFSEAESSGEDSWWSDDDLVLCVLL